MRRLQRCAYTEDVAVFDRLFGFACALKLRCGALIFGVLHFLQHPTEGFGWNHETRCQVEYQIQMRNIKDQCNSSRLSIGSNQQGIHPMATTRIHLRFKKG